MSKTHHLSIYASIQLAFKMILALVVLHTFLNKISFILSWCYY